LTPHRAYGPACAAVQHGRTCLTFSFQIKCLRKMFVLETQFPGSHGIGGGRINDTRPRRDLIKTDDPISLSASLSLSLEFFVFAAFVWYLCLGSLVAIIYARQRTDLLSVLENVSCSHRREKFARGGVSSHSRVNRRSHRASPRFAASDWLSGFRAPARTAARRVRFEEDGGKGAGLYSRSPRFTYSPSPFSRGPGCRIVDYAYMRMMYFYADASKNRAASEPRLARRLDILNGTRLVSQT